MRVKVVVVLLVILPGCVMWGWAQPNAGFSISGIPGRGSVAASAAVLNICQGTILTLHNTAFEPGGAISTNFYTYKNGKPAALPRQVGSFPDQQVTFNSPGIDTIWQTVTDGLNRASTTFQPLLISDVYPDSVFTYSPDLAVAACGTSIFTFTARNQFGDSGLIYNWTFQGSSAGNAAGSPVSIQFNSATGPGTGNYQATLTVINPLGCTSTSAQSITVSQIPDNTITSPNAGMPPLSVQSQFPVNTFILCGGTDSVFKFVNSSATAATNAYYHIVWGNGTQNYDSPFWPASDTISQAYPPGYDTLTITITGSNTCANTSRYIIYHGSPPPDDVSVKGLKTICTGDSTRIVLGNSILNGPAGTRYNITIFEAPVFDTAFNQSAVNPAGSSFSHIFNQPSCGVRDTINRAVNNEYEIYFSAANACGSVMTSAAAVNVSGAPSVLINAPQTICNHSTAILSNITNWSGVYPYCGQQPADAQQVWVISTPPGGSYTITSDSTGSLSPYVSGSDTITALFNGAGVYHARLYVKSTNTAAADCVTADRANYGDAYICVRNQPQPDFLMDNQSICQNSAVKITNNIDTSLICGQDAYNWSVKLIDSSAICPVFARPQISDSTARLPSIKFPAPGLYNITLSVTPAGGNSSSCAKTVSHTVMVYGRPGIKFYNLPALCPGDSLSPAGYVLVDSCFVPGTLQYTWWTSNLPDTAFYGTNPGYITYATPGTWYLNLSLSTVNSCGDSSVAAIVTVTNPGTVNALPDTSICSGSPLNIRPSGAGIVGGYYWASQIPAANTITGNSANTGATGSAAINDTLVNITSPPAVATATYYVYAASGTCRSNIDTVVVTVLPRVAANAGPDQFLCKGTDSCYLNAVLPASGQATGTWSQVGPAAVIANIHDPQTKVTGLTTNYVYTFIWTVSGAGMPCADTTDTMRVYLDTIVNFIDQPPLVCASDSITIKGHVPAGIDSLSYTYQWLQSNDGINYTPVTAPFSNLRNIVVQPPADKYYRRVTYYHSCADTSSSVIIYFKPGLNPPAFTETALTGCAPLGIRFTNQTRPPPLGSFNYQWFVDNNAISQAADSVSYTFGGTFQGFGDTTYHVILNATNGCTSLSDTAVITVTGAPKASFIPDATAGCSPLSIMFTNNSIGSNAIYTWNYGDGTGNKIDSSKTFSHIFHASAHSSFVVTLQAVNTCGSSSDSVLISINSNTINLHFGAATPSNFGCTGDTLAFNNNTTGANVFNWSFGDGSSLVTANGFGIVEHIYQYAGIDTIKLCASNGCTLDTCTTTVVNIKQTPTAIFSVSPAALCTGASVTTINQSLPVNSPLAFKWSFGDGTGFYPDPAPEHKYNLPGTDTVWLFAAALFDQGFSCSDSAFQIVTVIGATGQLMYSDSICAGNVVVFQVSGSNSSKYLFDFGDYTPPLSTTSPSANHTYIIPGVYQPKVTLTNGTCSTVISGPDSLRADKVTAAFKSDSIPFCDSTTLTLSDSSYSFFGITAYEWSFNGKTFTGNTASGTVMQTNNYPVSLKVTGATGCTSQTASQVYVYVHQTPAGNIAIISDTCAMDTVFFNAALFSNDPLQYTWSFANGERESGQNASTVFDRPGFYNVNLTALSSFGCTDVVNYVVAIKSTPLIKVFPGNNVWLCAGSTTELKAFSPYVTAWNWGPATGLSCFNCGTTLASPATSTLYTVTGINDEGCAATDTVVLNVQQPFTIAVNPPGVSICTTDTTVQPIQFFASGADNYTWSPATWLSDSAVFDPVLTIPPGQVQSNGLLVYHITGYDPHYCFTDTTSVIVSIGINPTINLGAGDSGVAGRVVILAPLSVTGGPFKSFTWNVLNGNGSVTCLNSTCDSVQLTINSNVTFQVTGVNNLGCVATDTIRYTAFCNQDDDQVYIPTAFSPDGDGINDVLMVQGKGIIVESFKVFNRWGQQVFDGGSNFAPGDAAHGWDGTLNGKPVQEDVYVYIAKVECTAANTSYSRKGNVTLIRVKK